MAIMDRTVGEVDRYILEKGPVKEYHIQALSSVIFYKYIHQWDKIMEIISD